MQKIICQNKPEASWYVTLCGCVNVYVCTDLWMQAYVLVCAWENRRNLIYSPRGHLLTESKPLTGPSPNGSLTRLPLYIAAVMETSLEILVLLICALLPRFEQKCFAFCTQPFHWETPDALQLQQINQSTESQRFEHLYANWTMIPPVDYVWRLPMHGCPPLPAGREIICEKGIPPVDILCSI